MYRKKITPIYAPANDHRAIDLAERLIQTIKQQLSCMKTQLKKKFNLEQSLHAIIQQLRISKQNSIDTTPFEAQFGRTCNPPISTITTKSNNNHLNYNKLIQHYLNADIIPGRSHRPGFFFDTEIEKLFCAANNLAQKEQEKVKYCESRLIWSEGLARPIPCSERSVQVKIARKIHESPSQKKNLDCVYEVLAPGSTVRKISPTASVVKEPNRQEVRVRNSDIAKFGTKNERDTELGQYIDRRPKKISEKTLDQKITNHRSENT